MKTLIINFYSPQNGGDLAILEQTVKLIRAQDAAAQIQVCVSDTDLLPEIAGVQWVRSWNSVIRGPGRVAALRELLRAYARADVIISLGGGYFFVHDYRPFSTYATASLVAALLARKPVLCFPQSFGPFRFRYQAWLAAFLLRGVSALMIREEQSMALLRRADARLAARATLAPDSALTLALETAGPPSKSPVASLPPRIGITMLDWASVNPLLKSRAGYEQSIAEFIVHAWRTLQAQTTLFVQCRSHVGRRDFENDMGVIRRVVERVRSIEPAAGQSANIRADLVMPADYVQAYGEMDFFIGTRMHSLIFAACAGVPVISIGYQPKSLGLMQMLGLQDYVTEMAELTSQQLIQRFERGWSERSRLSVQVRQAAVSLGDASRKAMVHALSQVRHYNESTF